MGGGVGLTSDNALVPGLSHAGVARGDLVGLAVTPDGTVAVTTADRGWVSSAAELARADREIRPRWVTWSQESARHLIACGVCLATCWDQVTHRGRISPSARTSSAAEDIQPRSAVTTAVVPSGVTAIPTRSPRATPAWLSPGMRALSLVSPTPPPTRGALPARRVPPGP